MGLGAVLVGIINALAWPAAVMFIAIGYKPELATLLPALLRRGFGIERYRASAKIDAAEQRAAAAVAATEPGKLKEFPDMARTPAIEWIEHELHAALAKRVD